MMTSNSSRTPLASSRAIALVGSARSAASGTAMSLPHVTAGLVIAGLVLVAVGLGARGLSCCAGKPLLPVVEPGIPVGARAESEPPGALGDFPAVPSGAFICGCVYPVG